MCAVHLAARLASGFGVLMFSSVFGCVLSHSTPPAPTTRGAGAPCATDVDCVRVNGPCNEAVCVEGRCEVHASPAGTVPAKQTKGDCSELVCDGRGETLPRFDPNDVPADDDNACTEEVCDGDVGAHKPLAAGAACGEGHICTGNGVCGVCIPRNRRCEGKAPSTCDAQGAWQVDKPCDGAAPVCDGGTCEAIARYGESSAFACALLGSGSVRCARGPEGSGLEIVPQLSRAVQIAVGKHQVCGLVPGGVACVGEVDAEALALRSFVDKGPYTAVAAGDGFACALVGGHVQCFGAHARGQLGDGAKGASKPVAESAATAYGLAQIVGQELVVGELTSCAVGRSGDVFCFGRGVTGAAPAPAKGAHPKPPALHRGGAVRGLDDAIKIAAGDAHACVLKKTGEVACWGAGKSGQLGDGSANDRATPALVRDVKNVQALALGAEHTCALGSDGTVRCWGRNNAGQLGDGTTEDRRRPTLVAGLTDVRAITANGSSTCAIAATRVSCWGAGKQASRATPEAVAF
jgi:hypothetical protein